MQTINTSEAVVLRNVQRWQEEKKRRTKKSERIQFKQHFNNVGDKLAGKAVRV